MSTGKTRKSVSKRLKITRRGKFLTRKIGQNHFLAKQSRKRKLNKKRLVSVSLTKKQLERYS